MSIKKDTTTSEPNFNTVLRQIWIKKTNKVSWDTCGPAEDMVSRKQ